MELDTCCIGVSFDLVEEVLILCKAASKEDVLMMQYYFLRQIFPQGKQGMKKGRKLTVT